MPKLSDYLAEVKARHADTCSPHGDVEILLAMVERIRDSVAHHSVWNWRIDGMLQSVLDEAARKESQ